MLGQPAVGLRPVLVHRIDATPEVIDRRHSRPTPCGCPRSAGNSGTGSRSHRHPAGCASRSGRADRRSAVRSPTRSHTPALCTTRFRRTRLGYTLVASTDLLGVEHRGLGTDAQPAARSLHRYRPGVLVDLHARLPAGPRQLDRQLGRVHDRAGVGLEQARPVGRRRDLRTHLLLIRGTGPPQPRRTRPASRPDAVRWPPTACRSAATPRPAPAVRYRLPYRRGSPGPSPAGWRTRRPSATFRSRRHGSGWRRRTRRCDPEAAQPIRFASISTILRSGFRSAACSAATGRCSRRRSPAGRSSPPRSARHGRVAGCRATSARTCLRQANVRRARDRRGHRRRSSQHETTGCARCCEPELSGCAARTPAARHSRGAHPSRPERVAELVPPAFRGPDIPADRHVFVGLQFPDVVGVDLLGQSVVRPEQLVLIGAEEPVPQDEDARRSSCPGTAGPCRGAPGDATAC